MTHMTHKPGARVLLLENDDPHDPQINGHLKTNDPHDPHDPHRRRISARQRGHMAAWPQRASHQPAGRVLAA